MSGIRLKQCKKVYVRETHRSRMPEITLQTVERLKTAIGVFAFTDATDLDRIGLPVFTCQRIRPDQSGTWHTGKGLTVTQAQVSLLMEGVERYCSEFREEDSSRLITGSYSDLRTKQHVLDPQELILPGFSEYHSTTQLHWVAGFDLTSREAILVPAAAVYHPFHLDSTLLIRTHTNGIASGNTLEEAVFHGLTELIERDVWSIAQFQQDFGTVLVLDGQPSHQFLSEILEKFAAADVAITARLLTTDSNVPVVAAFSQDQRHPSLKIFDGFGAHLDPRVAMARAVLELATTRAFFLQRYGLERLLQPVPYYYGDADLADPRFTDFPTVSLGSLPLEFDSDIREDIRTITTRLKAQGLERVIAVDLTRAEIDIPTVRMIVPGLEVFCFDQERRGSRLYR
jgi:thioglycine synthase